MSATLSRSLTLAAACWGDLSEQAAFDRTIEVRCANASSDEKAAVRSILYCALRRAVFLERLVAKLVSRRPTPEVAALLAVSLSELNEQPDKPYVVVNEAINAARMNNATYRASGLINACLRRYLREKAALDKTILADRIARYNAPGWWIDRMRKEFGPQNLDTLFETLHKKPPMTLRVNVRKTSVEKWLTDAQAAGCPARALGGQAVLLEKARPVHRIPGFAEGLVSVQDAGAQLAGLFLAPKAGERILDACAAPAAKRRTCSNSPIARSRLWSPTRNALHVLRKTSRDWLSRQTFACATRPTSPVGGMASRLMPSCLMHPARQAASCVVTPRSYFLVARTILLPSRNSKNAFWKPFGPSSDLAAGSSMPSVRCSLKKVRSRSGLFLKRTMMHKPLHFQSARVRNCA